MSERAKKPRIPLLAKVGAGVLSLVGLVAAVVFVPWLHWLGWVLVYVIFGAAAVWRIYDRSQWRKQAEANAKAYRDEMAAFGVKRTGNFLRRPGLDF